MSRRRKIAFSLASILVAGLLFTAFILPSIVRSQLEKQIGSATDRTCSVGGVSINPLTWSVEVRKLNLSEKGSPAVFVSFSSLKARVSPTSVWRLAPVVADIRLTAPYVHLLRAAPNSYNFTDIIDKNAKKPKKESGEPAKFSLNNIVIENGRIQFDDRAPAKPAMHTVEELSLQVPFISNISYFAEKYIDPKLSARVNGAPFHFAGKLKPFEKGLEATLNINCQGLDIPYYAPYFPQELPFQVRHGKLSTSLLITHRLVRAGKPDITVSGKAGIQGLEILEKPALELFSLKGVEVDIRRLALMSGSYELDRVSIVEPHLHLHGGRDGEWNLSRLTRKRPAAETETGPAEEPEKESGKAKPDLQIKSLQMTGGKVTVRDDRPTGGFSAELLKIGLKVDNFASKGELPAPYKLTLETGRKETLSASGNIAMEPLAVSSRVSLADVSLDAPYPYFASLLAEPVQGRADCSGDISFSADRGLTVEQFMLRLKEMKVPFGKNGGAVLPLIVAEGGVLNLKEKTASIASITATGGRVSISRDSSGKLSPSLLLREKTPASTGSPAAKRGEEGKPFSWKIGAVAVNGLKLDFTDGMLEDNPRFEVRRINAGVSSITGPKLSAMPVNLSISYGAKGSVSAKGRLKASPFGFRGDIAVRSFPFVDFDSYLPEGVNLLLLDGKLDLSLYLDLMVIGKKLGGSFRGEGEIRDFHSIDGEEENDLLKWETLSLEKFSGTVEPFSLQMSGLSMNNYYARVIVNKNGRLNFQDVYRPAAKAPADASPAAPDAPPAGSVPAAKEREIRIDTVTLSEGTLDFSDHHLNRDFATTMLRLGGRISGLSSEPGSTADIDLRGNLENHSPLKISGRVNPLARDLFLDMQIAFNDIELSPLTPYSGTYLGYAIDKGKLSLALKYLVENRNLTAENRVFLDQFTFGEKIESQKATSLPVKLGVALLKDRNGEIHLDLPLSGRTDSPKFSIWGLLGQVLKNLLVKAATSPMALLQAGFGGGADFSSVSFASGSSRISGSEEEKLRTLAKALIERPGIRLEITGFADRERDPEGYRNELLLKKMKNEKFVALARERRESSGLSPEAMEIPAAEQSKWLKAVYEKEKFPRPRTIIGTLKSLPDEEMKKLILANTTVGDQQLRALARERAVTVMNYLLEDGKLPKERIFEKSGDPFAAAKEGKAGGRVEFGVSVK